MVLVKEGTLGAKKNTLVSHLYSPHAILLIRAAAKTPLDDPDKTCCLTRSAAHPNWLTVTYVPVFSSVAYSFTCRNKKCNYSPE